MPLTDAEIKRAQEAEAKAVEASVEAHRALIPILEREAALFDARMRKLKADLAHAQATGAATAAHEKAIADLSEEIDKNTKALRKASTASKEHTESTKRSSLAATAQAAAFYEAGKQAYAYASSIEESLVANKELVLATKALERQVSGFGDALGDQRKDLDELRKSFSLTRKEYQAFLQSYTKGVEIGLKVSQVKALGDQLMKVRGQAEGLKALGTLMESGISADALERLQGGDKGARNAASRVANNEQRGVLADLNRAPDKDAKASMTRAYIEKIGDDIKASLLEGLDKMTGGLAGALGPSGVLAGLALAQLWQLKQILVAVRQANMTQAGAAGGGGGGGFGGNAGLSGRGMKIAGGVAIAGMIAAAVGETVKANTEEGSGAHTAGKAASAVGGIAGMAGTGAMLGSFAGPWGTAAGAIIGAGIGIWQNWGDVVDVSKAVSSGFENLVLNQAQLAAKMKKEEIARQKTATSVDSLNAVFDAVVKDLQNIEKESQEGYRQERGRTAQALMSSTAQGGGSVESLVSSRFGGLSASSQYSEEARKRKIDKVEKNRAIVKNLRDKGEITKDDYNERIQAINRTMEKIRQDSIKSLDSLDFTQYLPSINERSEALLNAARQEKAQIDQRVQAYGITNASMAEVTAQQKVSVDLAKEEIIQNEQKLNAIRVAAGNEERILKQMARLNPAIQNEVDVYLAANKKKLANQEAILKTEKQAAKIAQAQAAISAMRAAAEMGRGTVGYQGAQSAAGLAQAGLELGNVAGMDPTIARKAFAEFADTQKTLYENLKRTKQEQIDGINRVYEAEKARLTEAKDVEALRNLEIQHTNHVNQVSIDLLSSEAKARSAALAVGKEAYDRERALINVKQETLSTEKDLAEYLGSSYSTIFNIQGQMLDQQIAAHEVTRQRMAEIEQLQRDGVVNAENIAEYQQLQTQNAKEAAEITKSSLGRQRDFLDKALGKAFGVGSGSKFNPVMNDRMMFGEYMTGGGKDGLRVGGQAQTIGERERKFSQQGAQRPMAPIGGVTPGFGQGAGAGPGQIQMGPGSAGFAGSGRAQPAARGPGQVVVTEVDISGKIDVVIEMKTNLFTAMVEKIINMKQKRGGT